MRALEGRAFLDGFEIVADFDAFAFFGLAGNRAALPFGELLEFDAAVFLLAQLAGRERLQVLVVGDFPFVTVGKKEESLPASQAGIVGPRGPAGPAFVRMRRHEARRGRGAERAGHVAVVL